MKLWKLRFEDDAFALIYADSAEHALEIARAHTVTNRGGLGLWWIDDPALEIIEVEPCIGVIAWAEM